MTYWQVIEDPGVDQQSGADQVHAMGGAGYTAHTPHTLQVLYVYRYCGRSWIYHPYSSHPTGAV